MLEWETHPIGDYGELHTGRMNGEVYAYIAVNKAGHTGYQFRGLQGADLDSEGSKEAQDLETAKKICTAMMGAWKHKFQ